MDAAYDTAATKVGFSCNGCDGVACCTVDVTLHTFAEMLYLRRGFTTLDMASQLEILGRCNEMIDAKLANASGDAYRNLVCVLNRDGLCRLYGYRPMICRLAGIPHFFVRPDGSARGGGGCPRFEQEVATDHPDLKIDRTVFYQKMAEIEIELVRAHGKRTTSRTVSETLGLEDPENLLP
jgi:Fe-S-cluster containining protein